MIYKVTLTSLTLFLLKIISSVCVIQVGEIFDGSNQLKELAFEVAIDMVNSQQRSPRHILKPIAYRIPSEEIINAKKGVIIDMTWNNPYTTLEITCTILKRGVVGLFNLLKDDNSNTVKSICDVKEIPVIQTTLDYEQQRDCCTVNLFPHPPILFQAFVELIRKLDWKEFTIVYENLESLPKISEILKSFDNKHYKIAVRQLRLNGNGNYITTLKQLRRSGHTNFVLDCTNDNLNEILSQIQQVGLIMNDYNYIVLNLDFQTVDIESLQFSKAKIIGLRLFNPLNFGILEFARAMRLKQETYGFQLDTQSYYDDVWKLQTDIILLVDAVRLFAEVLKDHRKLKPKPLYCNSSDSWEHGSTIFNFMKTKSINGLSGKIDFDHHGFRTEFSLDIIEFSEAGIITIGRWDPRNKLTMEADNANLKPSDGISLVNMTFNVMVCDTPPYMMLKDSIAQLNGNERYEGFGIDIIKELASLEGFNYTFIRNEDDKNGALNPDTGTWDGMIGDVLNGVGDLAIGDLTITRDREKYVDFTAPFMSLGVQILYVKPQKAPPGFFSFATPFAADVWILLGITYFGMSLMFFVIARLCPSEWDNPFPCLERPRYLLNEFNLKNCVWLITANLMQEGADIAPKGVSTRILTSFWSFFILIMLSTYTANMAAFLTAEKDEWPFTDVNELVDRADNLRISYGAVSNGSTHKFFQESEDGTYRKISAYMDAHPNYMVPWYELGIDRVKDPENKYAFFMESSSIKYVTERECNLTAIGYYLDEKYYGIAMRKNSVYRNRLSAAVLKLTEMGIIADLERKWWQQERGGGQCGKPTFQSALPLNIKHISGILWLTFGGILISCVTVILELLLKIIKKHKEYKHRIKELKKELKFYINFDVDFKPTDNNTISTEREETSNV